MNGVVIGCGWRRTVKLLASIALLPASWSGRGGGRPMGNAQHRVCCRGFLGPLLCGFALAGSVGSAEPPRCAGPAIAAPLWTAAERDRLCAAARDALAFLRDAGLALEGNLTIRPLDDPSTRFQGCEIGHFDIARNEIRILTLQAAMGAPRPASAFGVPMTPALWAAILARFADTEAYASVEAISSLYYLMAPGQFAVKVHLHYLNLGDGGPEFLHWLLRNGLPS